MILLLLACGPEGLVDCNIGGSDEPEATAVATPAAPPTPEEPETPTEIVCEPVGTGVGDGFFALAGFNGDVYAGTFGYGLEGTSQLYRHPGWQQVFPGLQGIPESVCDLREFDGQLYANTESSGDLFRSADGTHWERVWDGPGGTIGCATAVFGGQIYAVNYDNVNRRAGRILRSSNGAQWDVVYDSGASSRYLRELVVHDGVLHAFATDENSTQGYWLQSTDGASWSEQASPSRFFRGLSSGGQLWIGSTSRSSNGVAGIWTVDNGVPSLVTQVPDAYVTEMAEWEGQRFAGTSVGWKNDSGTSRLLAEVEGAWEEVCSFPGETAVWAVEATTEGLFVGTWTYGSGGRIYAVERRAVDAPPTPPPIDDSVDCGPIAATPGWEVCDTTADTCAGVFSDGAGCEAYCGSAGLQCLGRYGGEPGCQFEPNNVLACGVDNNHQSDWCICG